MRFRFKRVCSSAWLERTPDKGEVGGSSPPRPTIFTYDVLSKEAKVIRAELVLATNSILRQLRRTYYNLLKLLGENRGKIKKL